MEFLLFESFGNAFFCFSEALDGTRPIGRALTNAQINLMSRPTSARSLSRLSERGAFLSRSSSVGNALNQPVTFGHRIKSSGYAPQAPKYVDYPIFRLDHISRCSRFAVIYSWVP